jgi:hypothetical protein
MENSRPKKLILLLIMSALILCHLSPTRAETKFKDLTKHKGVELKTDTFLCKSNYLAAAGFWRNFNDSTIEEGIVISDESKTTTWRITLKGITAEVIRYSGATETLEQPEIFSVEPTIGGFLLISKQRSLGESTQIITIDVSSSSFVYSSQHVNPLWNRANVFYGTCVPYK